MTKTKDLISLLEPFSRLVFRVLMGIGSARIAPYLHPERPIEPHHYFRKFIRQHAATGVITTLLFLKHTATQHQIQEELLHSTSLSLNQLREQARTAMATSSFWIASSQHQYHRLYSVLQLWDQPNLPPQQKYKELLRFTFSITSINNRRGQLSELDPPAEIANGVLEDVGLSLLCSAILLDHPEQIKTILQHPYLSFDNRDNGVALAAKYHQPLWMQWALESANSQDKHKIVTDVLSNNFLEDLPIWAEAFSSVGIQLDTIIMPDHILFNETPTHKKLKQQLQDLHHCQLQQEQQLLQNLCAQDSTLLTHTRSRF